MAENDTYTMLSYQSGYLNRIISYAQLHHTRRDTGFVEFESTLEALFHLRDIQPNV